MVVERGGIAGREEGRDGAGEMKMMMRNITVRGPFGKTRSRFLRAGWLHSQLLLTGLPRAWPCAPAPSTATARTSEVIV
jgi:hypothetical protein